MAFRLFDLPFVALKTVLKSMDYIDFFDLSLSSKKSKQIIKSTHCPELIIKMDACKDIQFLRLSLDGGVSYDWWYFGSKKKIKRRHKMFRTLDGYRFKFRKVEGSVFSGGSSFTVKLVLSYMKTIFNCRFTEIEIETKKLKELSHYLSEVKSCENFTLYGNQLVSNENMDIILKEIKVSGTLDIDTCQDKYYRCANAVFTSKSVVIDSWSMPWLTSSNLLSSDCEEIKLLRTDFPLETFELFVTRWLEGDSYQRLQRAKIEGIPSSDLEILKSRGTAWNPQLRGRCYVLKPAEYSLEKVAIDCSNGIDITRSDGTLATVLIADRTFQMFVWHERFQEVTEEHEILQF